MLVDGKLGLGTIEENFFSFSQKNKDGEVRLGTLGDALRSLLLQLPFMYNLNLPRSNGKQYTFVFLGTPEPDLVGAFRCFNS